MAFGCPLHKCRHIERKIGYLVSFSTLNLFRTTLRPHIKMPLLWFIPSFLINLLIFACLSVIAVTFCNIFNHKVVTFCKVFGSEVVTFCKNGYWKRSKCDEIPPPKKHFPFPTYFLYLCLAMYFIPISKMQADI